MKVHISLFCCLSIVLAEPPIGNGYAAARSGNVHNHNHHHLDHQGSGFQRSLHPSIPFPFAPSRFASHNSRSQDFENVGHHNQEHDLQTRRFNQQDVSTLSQKYDVPESNDFNSYQSSRSLPLFGAKHSQGFSTSSRSLSSQFGVPDTRDYGFSSLVRSSNPNQRLSDSYGAPNARDFSDYGNQASRSANLFSSLSSYSSARSSPSQKYGAPTTRDSKPSDQYGVPDQYNNADQGYGDARAAEELNQELANYGFGYEVNDYETGSEFGHTETRVDNRAEGSYYVVLPDGKKQVVEYEADEGGFKPRISVEPANAGGYDDNAADLARSGGGHY